MGQYLKLNDRYGSKKGFIKSKYYRIQYQLGFYRTFENIDFSVVKRLVFVCSGNICRSALAEYIAHRHNFPAISFGLHCRGNDPADNRVVEFAQDIGIDMKAHRTTNIKEYTQAPGDLIIFMEPSHFKEWGLSTRKDVQVTFLTIWGGRGVYLHDPYTANSTFFEECARAIQTSTQALVEMSLKAQC
jgi:protein-tyrosine phosphatase